MPAISTEMKEAVILGSGTAGTMMANLMAKKLPKGWSITVVDQHKEHYYQPGFLFVPFDIYQPKDVVKTIDEFLPEKATVVKEVIDRIDHENNVVLLQNGSAINYDILVIATGSRPVPEEVAGMAGEGWYKDVFDFYTYEGACKLREKLQTWEGGKLVVHITEMPIKCPVAPLEFAFLADAFFTEKGMRDKVDITFVTPLSGAFTKPKATEKLSYLLEQKNIRVVPDFAIEKVDHVHKKIHDYGGKDVDYDLLVTVPTNMGDSMIERSGIGDDLNFVPTDKCTLQSKFAENVFVIGDATDLPASKAGSVAHFEAEVLIENIVRFINAEELHEKFDGHSNCFIETGHGKALLIDFNYTHEPVEGSFPLGGIGPLKLLKETRMNHLGKLAFRWVYWNMLLKGIPIPFVPATMSEAGKKLDKVEH